MQMDSTNIKLTCLGKYGPFPSPGGASSGYLLQASGQNILLECGSGVFSRLQQHCPFHELHAVVLSHLHVDHTTDMRILSQALRLHGSIQLDTYLPDTPEQDYKDIVGRNFNTNTLSDGMEICLGDIHITFHEAKHPVECYAMAIEHAGKKLFFTGDTNWYDALIQQARGADLLLSDCALLDKIWQPDKPHLSPRLAGRLAREAQVSRLLLTHIIPGMDSEQYLVQARAEYPQAELIQEGQVYVI